MEKYILKIKSIIAMNLIFSILFSITIAMFPYLSKLLFDYEFNKGFSGVWYIIIAYAVCIILTAVTQYIAQKYEWKILIKFNIMIKSHFMRAIFERGYIDYSKKTNSEYISMLENDIKALESSYVSVIIDVIRQVINLLVYGVFMFVFIDIRIAVVILIASIITIIVPKFTSNELSNKRKLALEERGRYLSRVNDLLSGYKFINKNTVNQISAKHENCLTNTENELYNFGIFNTFVNILNAFVLNILSISVFSTVGYLLLKGQITIGTGVATLGYVESFLYPMEYILNDISSINSAKGAKERVMKFLNTQNEDKENMSIFKENIEFKNVSVKYDNVVLDKFSYVFEKNKKYAILGHNGSGKSTILNALMNYIEISEGEIKIDKKNIANCDTSDVMTCVNQSEHVFDANYADNIRLFNSYDKNIADVEKLLKTDIVDTIKSKGSCKELSGGEKQVLNILRMLLIDTPIFLLDEPFSAVDVNATKILEKAIFSIPDKTMIVVTHKIMEENLKYFDEILTMEKGQLIKVVRN